MDETTNTTFGEILDDEPLSEAEVNRVVAELADKILSLTEDPGEHEQIVNELGDVLEGWDKSFPLLPHPLTQVVNEIYADQKNHVKVRRSARDMSEIEQVKKMLGDKDGEDSGA
jgi:hypothetical protein